MSEPAVSRGWRLYYFRLFELALDEMEAFVTALAATDPTGYKSHPRTKLLAAVYRVITQVVPANPDARDFRLGHVLGPEHANWRRVKRGLPARYRLFFRFASATVGIIVYAWLNDDHTLRKQGARSDVYAVFRRMLERGEVPTSLEDLLRASTEIVVDGGLVAATR